MTSSARPARARRTDAGTGRAHAGSRKWLQIAVSRCPGLLQPPALAPLDWLSPVAAERFAEYADGAFLHRLGLSHLRPALAAFWPAGGPRWDGLARFDGGGVVLVEAKAHLREFLGAGSSASPPALSRISATLARTRAALGADDRSDWARVLYQYANRLAHLLWLREQGVEAHLLLVGFLGDRARGGPATAEAWQAAYLVADHALGLPAAHALKRCIHHVHPDVAALT